MIAAIGFAAKSLGSVKTKFCFSSGDGIATGKAEISGITTGRIGGGILIVSVRSFLPRGQFCLGNTPVLAIIRALWGDMPRDDGLANLAECVLTHNVR